MAEFVMEIPMVKVHGSRWVWGVILVCAATAGLSRGQTFTTLASFDGKNGNYPSMALVQATDGNFYGTTEYGGASCGYRGGYGCGTVFKINRTGNLTRLYSFCTLAQCADGKQPGDSLVQATNGKFYGTTLSGGTDPDGCGTVFEITAAGKLTTLHTFEVIDGCGPYSGLIQSANGNFYGTTNTGGAQGGGTVFEITAAGKFTSVYSFCSLTNCADGERPLASLVQGADGNFYGTTALGGSRIDCPSSQDPDGCGTVFRITPAGKLATLYSFCSLPNCADGNGPDAPLIQAINGNLYGTTFYGGANCSPYGCGTAFKITPGGKLTTLYSFCSLPNCADGDEPAPVIQATDGNLYGTTFAGGTGNGNNGTIFQITPAGILTTLYSFCSLPNCADGAFGSAGLLQATNGIIYGTANAGGTSGDGTVFSLDMGLGPFVSFIRNPSKVGQQFGILGYGLTGTTGVSLNGIPAKFVTHADTLLIATVPAGATTGYVTVTTPSGTLTSNVPFRVIP